MSNIAQTRHYEISSGELAKWLERGGPDTWWTVDGDPLLTGRLNFPCPADELIPELQRINKPLLVQALKDDVMANGQSIDATKLDQVVISFSERTNSPTGQVSEFKLRSFYLEWKGSPHAWLLVEDPITAQQALDDMAAETK